MNRKAGYVVKWWVLGVLVFTSLMPGPVGAQTSQIAPVGQSTTFLPVVQKPSGGGDASSNATWSMAGANPQRTSWTAEQVPSAEYLASHRNEWGNGALYPQWYRPIEPYIPHKVQIIAANNTLFVSTSKGLYALDADTGDVKWVYPTEMPLGHSPTYHETTLFGANHPRRLYVGGLDHKIHAIDADPNLASLPTDPATGQRINSQKIWTFEAEQGFQTNPLVVELNNPADGRIHLYVYAGNRDSYEYAIEDKGSSVSFFWKYRTDGPVLFSTAISKDNQTIFFASNDSYAYALKAITTSPTGQLVWKSQKLPGAGFDSWWPVIYTDPQSRREVIVIAGSNLYRAGVAPGVNGHYMNFQDYDREAFPDYNNQGGTQKRGIPVGPRRVDGFIDSSQPNGGNGAIGVSTYFETKPWRRTTFVLDMNSGKEISFDFDNDAKAEYAPFLWFGSKSGNRYPPVVGNDGLVYQTNGFMYGDWINGGGITGWRYGTPYFSTPESYMHAVDEPIYYSAGGNLIYWVMHSDLAGGGFDTSKPNSRFWDNGEPNADQTREWVYFGQGGDPPNLGLLRLFPNYDRQNGAWQLFGGRNGTYGKNGDGNPPIPYKGKLYFHKGNAILVLGTTPKTQGTSLPLAKQINVSDSTLTVTEEQLRQKLASEVQKMIDAGHLRPAYYTSGLLDQQAKNSCGDSFQDLYSNPAELIYTLTRALPYLPTNMIAPTKSYLQTEFNAYSPYMMTHIGWRDGRSRDFFDLPADVSPTCQECNPTEWISSGFEGWGASHGGTNYPPHVFYALWKYALAMGYTQAQAKALFDASRGKLDTAPPANEVFVRHPFVLNSFINGYQGYLELQKMAGYPESSSIRDQLNTLRGTRSSTFTKDSYYDFSSPDTDQYCTAYNASQNFIYLTPELGQYLHDTALNKVQAALNEYYHNTPYWFVGKFEDSVSEGIFAPLYDVNLFQAKALILKESREELVKYLDAPVFPVGDLFYIQNLVAAIEAASTSATSSSPPDPADVADPAKIHNADVPPAADDLTVAESCNGYWPDMSGLAVLHFDPGPCFMGR